MACYYMGDFIIETTLTEVFAQSDCAVSDFRSKGWAKFIVKLNIMRSRGARVVIHYLDDFFTCSKGNSLQCQENLDIMLQSCETLGFAIQPSKVVSPTTCIELLGIIIDSIAMEIRISEEWLANITPTFSGGSGTCQPWAEEALVASLQSGRRSKAAEDFVGVLQPLSQDRFSQNIQI